MADYTVLFLSLQPVSSIKGWPVHSSLFIDTLLPVALQLKTERYNMEAFPVQFCRAIESCWKKDKYNGTDGSNNAKKAARQTAVVRLGGRKCRLGRLRQACNVRIKVPSPAGALARVRDAYVDVMLIMAARNQTGLSGWPGLEVQPAQRVPNARAALPACLI